MREWPVGGSGGEFKLNRLHLLSMLNLFEHI